MARLDGSWVRPSAKWGNHVLHGVGFVQNMGFGIYLCMCQGENMCK
jgi:hypothetical protein